MPVILKDLLFGVVLVCLMMVFTSLLQAAKVVSTEDRMPDVRAQETAVYPQQLP